jgi:phosphopantetheine--protein transferase-like protein
VILGIGLDVVNIDRFEILSRWSPRLSEQFQSKEINISSFAGEFAAREALIKAINQVSINSKLFNWADLSSYDLMRSVTMVDSHSGSPEFVFIDPYKYVFRDFIFILSISHDPPIAGAVVVAIHQSFNASENREEQGEGGNLF